MSGRGQGWDYARGGRRGGGSGRHQEGGRGGRVPNYYGSRDGGGGGGGGSGAYRGGGGGGGGGRDVPRGGGRHGGRGNNRDFGGRGRTSNRGPDLSGITKVQTNMILAAVSLSFNFYMYTVDAKHKDDGEIESRSRKATLFRRAIFNKLFQNRPDAEKNHLKRMIFFQGSYFFSARPIEELEGKGKLPRLLLDGTEDGGDTFRVVSRYHFKAPKVLSETIVKTIGAQPFGAQPFGSDDNPLSFDSRCADCSKGFGSPDQLMQHCKQHQHKPLFGSPEGSQDAPAEADPPTFIQYVNVVLDRALEEGSLVKWGKEFIDPHSGYIPMIGRHNDQPAGAEIFKGYSCEFNLVKPALPSQPTKAKLVLTVDLRAKVMRTTSLLDEVFAHRQGPRLSEADQRHAKDKWIGRNVIYKLDKKTYSVVDLLFNHSADTLAVEGLGISHALYFQQRKNVFLKHPNAMLMVEVLNRQKQRIYLPPELVCDVELDSHVKTQLPKIAGFNPTERFEAVHQIMNDYLRPKNVSKKMAGEGLLAACGVTLLSKDTKKATTIVPMVAVMPVPRLLAAGVKVPPESLENWMGKLKPRDAQYKAGPNEITTMNVIIFCDPRIRECVTVYQKIKAFVDGFPTNFKLTDRPEIIAIKDQNDQQPEQKFNPHIHPAIVQKRIAGKMPANTFVLEFIMPPSKNGDPYYPVIKQLLGQCGYLSQFLDFKKCDHGNRDNYRKSNTILPNLARQILQKLGARLWWVAIPEKIPLPAVVVGVDVFHAPRVYNPETKQRTRRKSCAAIVVQVIRPGETAKMVEVYSETFARPPTEEFGLEDVLNGTISRALRLLNVSPQSCIVWRDGISESSFDLHAQREIESIRRALANVRVQPSVAQLPTAVKAEDPAPQEQAVPLAYMVCQKRIGTKLFATTEEGGQVTGIFGAPPGTKVDAIQGLGYDTFYIQGRAPPYSTPKPVRYTVIEKDKQLKKLPELTWALCHDYPNWTGSIKVPSVCMAAHKLAMLAGTMNDSGESINHGRFANTMHYL